jgi:glucose/arabinose dehydrogenase
MRKICVFLLLLVSCQTFFAQPDLTLTQITSVSNAVDLTGAVDGSGRLFIVNQSGIIRIFDLNTNTLLPTEFLNITGPVLFGGERGLLGLAFHPDFQNNGYFYVDYIDDPSGDTHISRFTAADPASNATVDPATELLLLTIDQPSGASFTNHKGGDLNFGPDGYLYIAVGDGGSGGDPGNRAQNPQDLLGKILRIDVDNPGSGNNYGIPPSNPFAGTQSPTDYRDEIWALGVRNPWRFSFDRSTGDMYIADVGQGAWEEVDFQAAGSAGGVNYGWRCYEGNHTYDLSGGCLPMGNYMFPVFEYDHGANGGQSITGGFVYRGTDVPSLVGWYVLSDYVSGNFWLLRKNGATWESDFQPDVRASNITSFGEDDDGELYAARLSGPIYRVTASPLPVELLSFNATAKEGRVHLDWSTASEHNTSHFEIERSTENTDFEPIGHVAAAGESASVQRYSYEDLLAVSGENVYRLKMVDEDGSFKYSPIVSIELREPTDWTLSPNPANGKVSLLLDKGNLSALRLSMINVQGHEVLAFEESAPAFPYSKEFSVAELPAGIYFCRLDMDGKSEFRRLLVN